MTKNGFGGSIRMMVGFAPDGQILNVNVLQQAETPGLGAEITTAGFQRQFVGKTIYNDGKLVGIKVLKGAGASEGNPNAVDAISGGTITSRGVETMIINCLEGYSKYIDQCRAKMQESTESEVEPMNDESAKNQENE